MVIVHVSNNVLASAKECGTLLCLYRRTFGATGITYDCWPPKNKCERV